MKRSILLSKTTALLCCCLSLILVGCSQNNVSDLQAYVSDIQNKKYTGIEPLPNMVSYATHIYDQTDQRNPFVPVRDGPSGEDDKVCNNADRTLDALEDFPLDSLTMVGSLQQHGERWALIRSQDSVVYRRKTNDYIGQNNGRITRIDESSIELLEQIPDKNIGCFKKITVLSLNE